MRAGRRDHEAVRRERSVPLPPAAPEAPRPPRRRRRRCPWSSSTTDACSSVFNEPGSSSSAAPQENVDRGRPARASPRRGSSPLPRPRATAAPTRRSAARSRLAADAVDRSPGRLPCVVRRARPERRLVVDDTRIAADLHRTRRVAQQVRVVSLLPDEHEMRGGHELRDERATGRRTGKRIGAHAVPAGMTARRRRRSRSPRRPRARTSRRRRARPSWNSSPRHARTVATARLPSSARWKEGAPGRRSGPLLIPRRRAARSLGAQQPGETGCRPSFTRTSHALVAAIRARARPSRPVSSRRRSRAAGERTRRERRRSAR